MVSIETIYKYLYKLKQQGTDLCKYLVSIQKALTIWLSTIYYYKIDWKFE